MFLCQRGQNDIYQTYKSLVYNKKWQLNCEKKFVLYKNTIDDFILSGYL